MAKEKESVIELKEDELVVAKNLGMTFKVREKKYDTLKERVIAFLRFKKNPYKHIEVLEDVSFNIKKGESLGVIGHNGAGKSTLLKIVAGIYQPSKGQIKTRGSIVLLNIGAGFDMEATGEENIYINGALLGYSRKEMKERFQSIVDFSEIGDYINLPLKNYSHGMITRLGFAIASDIHPDLMLVDEVLSVGDESFKNKCMERIKELKEQGVSFLFVSHNISQVQFLCEKTIWIEKSKVMDYGETAPICQKYMEFCKTK